MTMATDSQGDDNSSVGVDNDTMLEEYNDKMAKRMIPVMAYLVAIMVLGIFGNSAVCYYYGWKARKSTGSLFILTLSIYDLFLCLLGVPIEIMDIRLFYIFTNRDACKLMRFVEYFVGAGSVFTLLVIAVDRYRKICKLKKCQIGQRGAKIGCALSVFAGILFSWFPLIIFDAEPVDVVTPDGILLKGHNCTSRRNKSFSIYIWIGLGIYSFSLLVSAVILFVMYGLVGWTLHKHARKSRYLHDGNTTNAGDCETSTLHVINRDNAQHEENSKITNTKSHKRLREANISKASTRFTYMMLSISSVFFLSYVPFIALSVWQGTLKKCEDAYFTTAEQIGMNIGIRSVFLNSVINPFIYGLFNPEFLSLCLAKLNCNQKSKNSPDVPVAGMSREDRL